MPPAPTKETKQKTQKHKNISHWDWLGEMTGEAVGVTFTPEEDWKTRSASTLRRSGPFHDLPRKELKLGKGGLKKGGSINGGCPKNGWFIMENPIKMI